MTDICSEMITPQFATIDKVKPGMVIWKLDGIPGMIGIVKKVKRNAIILTDNRILELIKTNNGVKNLYRYMGYPMATPHEEQLYCISIEEWEMAQINSAINNLKSKCDEYSTDKDCSKCMVAKACKGRIKKL